MQNYSGCWRLYNLAQGMPTTKEIWQSKIKQTYVESWVANSEVTRRSC